MYDRALGLSMLCARRLRWPEAPPSALRGLATSACAPSIAFGDATAHVARAVGAGAPTTGRVSTVGRPGTPVVFIAASAPCTALQHPSARDGMLYNASDTGRARCDDCYSCRSAQRQFSGSGKPRVGRNSGVQH